MNDRESQGYRPDDAELEELVAYLDGELEPDGVAKIERRLADDPEFRRRLKELSRAWEMLEWLPRSEVTEHFTETTVEMVAVEAERDLKTQQVASVRRHYSRRLLVALTALVASFAGFGLIWSWQQRDERQFLRDLPLIRELDMYQVADSVEFLQALEERGWFTDDEEIGDEDL